MTVINNPTQNIYTGGGHAFGCAAVKRGFSSLAFSYSYGDFVSSLGSGSWGVGKVVDGIALSNSEGKSVDGDNGIALSNGESKLVDSIAFSNIGRKPTDGIALSNIEHETTDGIALSNSESDTEDYT